MERTDLDRLRENEKAFAAANEGIRRAAERYKVDPVPFLCECSAMDSRDVILVPLAAYRKVRLSGGFIVRPGHDDPHVEHVIEQGADYVVVEKFRTDG